MRKGIGFVLMLLGLAAIIFAFILCAVNWIGTDAELYLELQTQADILEYAGISQEDLIRLDEALANCLKGDADALDGLQATVFGEEQDAFNERELTHMEDCRRLFNLLRRVMVPAWIGGAAAFLVGALLSWNRRRARLAAWLSPLILAIPLGAFAAWAVTDFNAAFNFFHEILFTNDLWLLDANTDLLIRICPSSMFMSMGVRIGILSVLAILAVPAFVTIFTPRKEEKR